MIKVFGIRKMWIPHSACLAHVGKFLNLPQLQFHYLKMEALTTL